MSEQENALSAVSQSPVDGCPQCRHIKELREEMGADQATPEQVAAALNAYDGGKGWRGRNDWQLVYAPDYGSDGPKRVIGVFSNGRSHDPQTRIQIDDARALLAGFKAQDELAELRATILAESECTGAMEALDGDWLPYKRFLNAIQQAWSQPQGYAQDPLELLTQLIDERDEARDRVVELSQGVASLTKDDERLRHPGGGEWVTIGRIKVDVENETETFERYPYPQPQAAAPPVEQPDPDAAFDLWWSQTGQGLYLSLRGSGVAITRLIPKPSGFWCGDYKQRANPDGIQGGISPCGANSRFGRLTRTAIPVLSVEVSSSVSMASECSALLVVREASRVYRPTFLP